MRLLGAGDNVVDRYHSLGIMFPGGNAVNVAVFAGRLGAQVAYLGVLGDDVAGRTVLQSLKREGVDTSLVAVSQGENAYADVDIVGTDRVFLDSSKGVSLFDPTAAQLDAMANFDIVHAGYAGSLLAHVPEIAKRTRTSFDFGDRFELATVASLLPHLYLASFSSGHISAGESVELVRAAVAGGADYALATRGENGAYLASDGWVIHQEADQIRVVDTLGAGDAFIASVLVGLLAKRDHRSILASASAHAAQVCLAHGAFGYGTPFHSAVSASTARTNRIDTEVSG